MNTENDTSMPSEMGNQTVDDLSNFDLTNDTNINSPGPGLDNKKKIIVLVVLLLLIGAAAWYFLFSGGDSSSVASVPPVRKAIPTKVDTQLDKALTGSGVSASGEMILDRGEIASVGSARLVSREMFDEAMGPGGENFDSVVMAKAVSTGINMSNIGANSVFSNLGFRNNDIVTEINGASVVGSGVDMMKSEFQNSDKLRIRVVRNGSPWKILVKFDE